MASKFANVCPMIAAVSAVGYCVWPYLDASDEAQPKAGEPPLLESRLIEPRLLQPSARNPFIVVSVQESSPTEGSVRAGPAPGVSGAGHAPTATPPTWVLGATLIHGARRAAVIDGRVYLLGERVRARDHPDEVVRLTRVERDGVRLSVAGSPREIVLTHPEPGRKAADSSLTVSDGPSRPRNAPSVEGAAAAEPLSQAANLLPSARALLDK